MNNELINYYIILKKHQQLCNRADNSSVFILLVLGLGTWLIDDLELFVFSLFILLLILVELLLLFLNLVSGVLYF